MSTISCTEFQRLLCDAVESNGDVTALPLAEHATACPDCREQWRQYCLLEQAVAVWRAETPAVDLVEAIVARHAFDQPTRAKGIDVVAGAHGGRNESAPRQQSWGSVVVAAAALLVASWTLFNVSIGSRESQVASSQRSVQSGTATVVADNSDVELETLVESAGSAYLILANQAADAVVEASRVVAPTRIALLQTEETEDDATKPGGWSNDLKPIGRDFGQALDFLFDAVPPETSSSI